MNDYQQRKADRAERFHQYADNAAERSDAAHTGVRQIADNIPFGQPILVGHHSEAHARKDAERIHTGVRRAIDESDKADYWRRRAEAVENDTSISLLDPDAVPLLTAKIELLEDRQASDKRVNKAVRSGKLDGLTDQESTYVAKLRESGSDYLGRNGIPAFVLTNRNANIRRYRARLALAEQQQSQRYSQEERRRIAIAAYYRDEYPIIRAALVEMIPSWARARGPKGEWREFKRQLMHTLTDDALDDLMAAEDGATPTVPSQGAARPG